MTESMPDCGSVDRRGLMQLLPSTAERIARSIEHVSLAAHPDFQDIFVACMNFPRS